jgi:hypothetical protein
MERRLLIGGEHDGRMVEVEGNPGSVRMAAWPKIDTIFSHANKDYGSVTYQEELYIRVLLRSGQEQYSVYLLEDIPEELLIAKLINGYRPGVQPL